MQFKADESLKQMTGVIKAEVTYKKSIANSQEDKEEEDLGKPLDLMKARKGFDLSEMILGRQAKPMEVEERSHGSSSSNKSDKEDFDWSKFDDQIPQSREDDENDFQFEHESPSPKKDEAESPEQKDDEDDEPFSYDNSMYSKFSSSYKFNMNDLADFKKVSVASRTSPEEYEKEWKKAAR